MLYVSGVDPSSGTVNGVKSSKVLESFERFHVGPTPEANSKFFPFSVAALTDTIATLHGCISQWYTKPPALLNVY